MEMLAMSIVPFLFFAIWPGLVICVLALMTRLPRVQPSELPPRWSATRRADVSRQGTSTWRVTQIVDRPKIHRQYSWDHPGCEQRDALSAAPRDGEAPTHQAQSRAV